MIIFYHCAARALVSLPVKRSFQRRARREQNRNTILFLLIYGYMAEYLKYRKPHAKYNLYNYYFFNRLTIIIIETVAHYI